MRKIGPFSCSPVSLGCMNLSHAYGTPPDSSTVEKLLHQALDMGYTMLDTAALYGFGANETLLGNALRGRRQEFVLASKCGVFKNEAGVREINGRPEVIKKTCKDSLKRLQTDVIDLYYLHRWDKAVPIEESVGALSDLVTEGHIKGIGLSEVSASTLRKAHAVHPIAAVQSEYSLWARNPEIAVLDVCKELAISFVAFSPLARAFLTGKLTDNNTFESKDIRRNMPRFSAENYPKNMQLIAQFAELAKAEDCSLAQLALAWLLGKDENIIVIPGTTKLDHLKENFAASQVTLSANSTVRLDEIFNPQSIAGNRYNAVTQAEIDTEEFEETP